jgi:two-component system, OmpR family, sensor kinase
MISRLSQKLYLRIWLAVVGMLLLLAAITVVAWQMHMDQVRAELQANPPQPAQREVVLRNEAGEILGQAVARPSRKPTGGIEFEVPLQSGGHVVVQMSARMRPIGAPADGVSANELPRPLSRGPGMPPASPTWFDARWMPAWASPPFSFLWLLAFVSVAIALGAYPVARRLTQRIETLRDGVKQFGDGDLSVRVPVAGRDEVAYLSEQFNASAERVQALMDTQKSLLANASHELRSPLARIRMGVEMLGSASSNAQSRERSQVELQRSIVELDELIEEILLSSRLDAIKHGKAQDLGSMESVDLLGLAAQESSRVGSALHFSEQESNHTLLANGKLLTRLMRNLLENAKRYGGVEIGLDLRRVTKSVPTGKDIWRITVSDRGVGVPESLRTRIFEPFYRLPGASEREGGVGLGLALVKSIAEQHGGAVRCESRPDGLNGACFVVELPAA